MKLDTNEPVGANFGSDEEMRRAIVQISQKAQSRTEHQQWADHLRFLTPYRLSGVDDSQFTSSAITEAYADSPRSIDSDVSEVCNCNNPDFIDFHSDQRHLRLTAPTEVPECIHYVAVSYCWTSTAKSDYIGLPFLLHESEDMTRRPKCPESLLDRVIQFATWKECSFIWIDQECIDQSDPLDQTTGIQSMDLVYQQALYCLAISEACIDSQRHIDAIAMLLENSPELEDEDVLRNVCEGLRRVMEDPWFERAWCLQESVSGNRRMTLLIRHEKDLCIPTLLESQVRGCFELDLPALHVALVTYQPVQMRHVSETTNSSVYALYQQIHDDWFENMAADDSNEFDAASRTVCNGAQALCYLERRKNLIVADRIAIMANLCRYERRLDSVALDEAGFGFSICATVLAAINGDFTLLSGYDDFVQTNKIGRKSRILSVQTSRCGEIPERPFAWSLPRTAKLIELSYLDHNADPLRAVIDSTSLDEGLGMQGSLWVAGCRVNLSRLVADFHRRWPQPILEQHRLGRIWEDTYDRPDPLFEQIGRDFLISLLCELSKSGFTRIVQLLWDRFRLRPTRQQREENEDAFRYDQAGFTDIVDLKSQEIKWLCPVKPRTIPEASDGHPFPRTSREEVQFLIRTIIRDGELLLSRPLRTDHSLSHYAGIFESLDEGQIIFVPNGMNRPNYSWYPCCWLVRLDMDTPVEGSVRSFGDRLVCGMWRHESEVMERILLL